jgi:hydrogenase-4 membrane subunit HyfE
MTAAMLPAGLALLFGFVLLAARRSGTAVLAYAAQSAAVAAAAGTEAAAQRSPALGAAALLVLAIGGLAIPAVLRRAAAEPMRQRAGWLAGALLFVVLAAVQLADLGSLAAGVLLAGLLATAASGGTRAAQAAGLGAMANGVVLAALTAPAGPVPALVVAASLALPAAAARA